MLLPDPQPKHSDLILMTTKVTTAHAPHARGVVVYKRNTVTKVEYREGGTNDDPYEKK